MQLEELTRPDLIFADLPGSDGPAVLQALASRAHARGLVDDAEALYRLLYEREQLGSTGLGDGVAVPHCKVDGIEEVALAVGIASEGVDFAAVDGLPVRLFFLIVSPSDDPAAHLQALASVSRWLKSDDHVRQIIALDDEQKVYDLICSTTATATP